MDIIAILTGLGLPGQTITIILAIVAVVAAVMPFMPKPADGATGVYPTIYKLLSIVAQNYGNAKNAPKPSQSSAS